MTDLHVILISVPGLRERDLAHLPSLQTFTASGDRAPLVPSFPCVDDVVQASILTGMPPKVHGIVGTGWCEPAGSGPVWQRHRREVLESPPLWEALQTQRADCRIATWLTPWICTGEGTASCRIGPAPDASAPDISPRDRRPIVQPSPLAGTIADEVAPYVAPALDANDPLRLLAHWPWVVDAAILTAREHRPHVFILRLPGLAEATVWWGAESDIWHDALRQLDLQLERLLPAVERAFQPDESLWLIAGEYGITPAKRIFWPNHLLLEAGLLQAAPPGSEMLWSFERSKAWACVESQHSHVYLQEPDERLRREVAELLASQPGIAEVLTREELNRYDLDHCRAGDLVVISAEDCWQSPLLQCDEQAAVQRAAWTLVEGNAVPPWRQFPGASAQRPSGLGIHGTYGAPPRSPDQRGVLLSRTAGVFPQVDTGDVDLADLILRQFGL